MKCTHCNGHGTNRGTYAPPHKCPDCHGAGEIVCPACGNNEPEVVLSCDNCGGRVCQRCCRYIGALIYCRLCAASDTAQGVEAVEDRLRSLGAIS